MAIEDFYQVITRKIPSTTINSYGEPVRSYTNTTINGYIGSRNDFEVTVLNKITIRTQYKFFSDTNCNERDLIIFDSETYRLISDMENCINKGHHYKGYLEKIKGVD